MSNRLAARWFFDVVSPFSYLHLSQFDRVHSSLDQLFWGGNTIDWMNAFVEDAGMFEREEMRRVADLEFGAHRKDDR